MSLEKLFLWGTLEILKSWINDCNPLITHRFVVHGKSRSQCLMQIWELDVTTVITNYCYYCYYFLFKISVYLLLSTATHISTNSDLHLVSPGLLYQTPNDLPADSSSPPPHKHRIILKPQEWSHISPTYYLHWLPVTDPNKPKLFSKIYKTNSCPGPYLWLLLHFLLHPSLYFTLKYTMPLQKLLLLPVLLISYQHDESS